MTLISLTRLISYEAVCLRAVAEIGETFKQKASMSTDNPTSPETDSKLETFYTRDVCAACCVFMGFSKEFVSIRRSTGGTFYCPNGHSLVYSKTKSVSGDRSLPSFENFEEDTCCTCGITSLLEKRFKTQRKLDRNKFYCPNGHSQTFKAPPPPPAPPPTPKTPADVDYEKLIAYHNALGAIISLEPKAFQNKKLLKQAILIAKNALDLQKIREEMKRE